MLMTNAFSPYRLWRSRHVQTIWPTLAPARIARGPWQTAERHIHTPEASLAVYSHTQTRADSNRDDVLLVHGMEGNADSGYIVRLANAGLQHGFHVHRMNLRGCGKSLSSNRLPYHAGLWSDILAVAREIKIGRRLFVVGVSLGGNMLLKMAGDLGVDMRRYCAGIATLSAAIDMAATERWLRQNRLYERYLLWHLVHSYRRRVRLHPDLYQGKLRRPPRHIYDFDDAVTGPLYGFAGADDYYLNTSSANGLANIALPALLIHAKDDPLVPLAPYQERLSLFRDSQFLHLALVEYGGHVGFVAAPGAWNWAAEQVMEFFRGVRQ